MSKPRMTTGQALKALRTAAALACVDAGLRDGRTAERVLAENAKLIEEIRSGVPATGDGQLRPAVPSPGRRT